MAKWGEGDPRWIVEERPDATNVNNWHWTEKNAGPWSTEKLKELFKDFSIDCEIANLVIKEVEKCEGEASANNRKGKLIFFYDWNLILKWEGKLTGDSGKVIEGRVNIPNLSEENDLSEIDITVTLNSSTEEGETIKAIMHEIGRNEIRKQLEKYISSLKVEFSRGMILPSKETKAEAIDNLSSGFDKKVNVNKSVIDDASIKKDNFIEKISTEDLKMTQKFQCLGEELFNALTVRDLVNVWTMGAVVELDTTNNGPFSLFGGNITGRYKQIKSPTTIQHTWRYKQWPVGHYSNVHIEITQKNDHTELKLHQTGIPKSELDVTRDNWERYYWEAMKRTFGWGAYINYST